MPTQNLVIGNDAELRAAVAEMRKRQERIDQINAECSAEVARHQKTAKALAEPHELKMQELAAAIERYATEHRQRLMQDAKSVDLGAGVIGYRKAPLSVVIDNPKAVVEALKKLKLFKLIKKTVKEDPDKAAIKKARDKVEGIVAGITFEEPERFYIEFV